MKGEITMERKNCAERLKELLEYFGIKQNDLSKRTGIPKSAISMYIKGERVPKQNRISDIADAYNINEAWLMGFDVPMKRQISDRDIGNAFANDNLFDIIDNIPALSPHEKSHFTNYLQLLEINRKKADDYVEQLLSIQQMDVELRLNAAHARTDIDIPEGVDTSEDDIMDDENF